MKQLLLALILSFLSACSYAPISISVPDFSIPAGSSASAICYTKSPKGVSVKFASVAYEGDALYTPSASSLGDNSEIRLELYGRASDPDPSSSLQVKCVSAASTEDIKLSNEPIILTANESKRVSAGGANLAGLVVKNEYWLGGSFDNSTLFSLPGTIDFTNGVVKAHF